MKFPTSIVIILILLAMNYFLAEERRKEEHALKVTQYCQASWEVIKKRAELYAAKEYPLGKYNAEWVDVLSRSVVDEARQSYGKHCDGKGGVRG